MPACWYYAWLSNAMQQNRCQIKNEDIWFLVPFLPNFVSTPCHFKLWVKMLRHPGKVLWCIQIALIENRVEGYMRMTWTQKVLKTSTFPLWSTLVVQSKTFQRQSKITLRKPNLGLGHHHCFACPQPQVTMSASGDMARPEPAPGRLKD